MPAWVVAAQWAARLVLVILFGLSVWSIAIMIDRKRLFEQKAGGSSDQVPDEAKKLITAKDWAGLSTWSQTRQELPALMIRAAIDVGGKSHSHIELGVKSFLSSQRTEMERGLTILATLGSNAPFIGLFGTVLGIIHAFAALADQKGGMASVMSGISEALLATAVGLFVAIPAVIAYNVFARKMRVLFAQCEALKDFYLSRLG